MTARLAALAGAVALLAGCGGGDPSGEATVWVTRDRGARVLLTATVEAGQTAMQALDSKADIETRYGGRFVQAIDDVEGSLVRRVDWFYFVNGIEADRGATEYRLHPGDIVWFDFRSWRRPPVREPVVVGAFPEPFLHGWNGKTRPTAIRYGSPRLDAGARALGRLLGARSVAPASAPLSRGWNGLYVLDRSGPTRFFWSKEDQFRRPGDPVVFVFTGDPAALARDPAMFRYRYRVP